MSFSEVVLSRITECWALSLTLPLDHFFLAGAYCVENPEVSRLFGRIFSARLSLSVEIDVSHRDVSTYHFDMMCWRLTDVEELEFSQAAFQTSLALPTSGVAKRVGQSAEGRLALNFRVGRVRPQFSTRCDWPRTHPPKFAKPSLPKSLPPNLSGKIHSRHPEYY